MSTKNNFPRHLITPLRDALYIVFPPAMSKLVQEASRPEPDFNELARIIRLDPGLSTTILTLVNSPFYSMPQKITDLKRAAVILGTKEILKITISATFHQHLAGKLKKNSSLKFNTWQQIIWGACASELLGSRICPRQTDSIYISALLKDLSLLLLCCLEEELPETFKTLLSSLFEDQCSRNELDLITLHNNQLEKEKELWGITHPELTLMLLEEWGFPTEQTLAVHRHHDIQNIEQYSPCEQAVILGTYWAEAEFSDKNVESLFQLRQWLKELYQIEAHDFEDLRIQNRERFKSLCQTFGIPEDDATSEPLKLYEQPVQNIQEFYFLAQEIKHINDKNDLEQVARKVARHLFWLWDIKEFYLALRSPLTDLYHLIHYSINSKLESLGEFSDFDQIAKAVKTAKASAPGKLFPILSGSCHFGGLWISGRKSLNFSAEQLQEFTLYLHFFSQAYEIYYRQLGIVGKAKTLDLLPVGIGLLDGRGRILQINSKLKEILALAAVAKVNLEIRGKFFWDLMSRTHKLPSDQSWLDFLNGKIANYNKLFCSFEPAENQKEPCWHIAAHRIHIEQTEQIMVVVQDISDITAMEADIIRQREFLHGIVESMQDLVLTVDEQGKILYATPRYASELLGKNLFAIASPSPVITPVWGPSILEQHHVPVEATLTLGNTLKSLEFIISKLSGPTPQYLIVGRDLTTIRRLEQKIKVQAVFDSLTKVFNRHQFRLFLKREIDRSKRLGTNFGIIFFDLDKFKEYNDQYGHQEGDQALAKFGQILRQNSRKGIDYPCRYGGDEFVLLAGNMNKETLENLATRIKNSFDQIFKKQLTLSIGLALLQENESPERLLYRADQAAYTAKNNGGDRIIWAEEKENKKLGR
jgi:diguanylate cyclase (GGDEF)-like protein